jgi:transcriptional regulator with XRE-family HTH domain
MAKLGDTPLAQWLNKRMALWEDPETGMWSINPTRLAKECGIPQSSVSNLLAGTTVPRPKTLDALAGFFKVHPIILNYITYHMESTEMEALDKLTELGQELYELPPGAVDRFMASLHVQAQANNVLDSANEKQGVSLE